MSDRIAVITGGGQGLGFAIARELVAAGYHVAIFGRRGDVLADAAARLGNATAIVADLTSPESITHAFAEVDMIPGELAILVNNAGVYIPFPIEAATDEWVMQIVGTNFTGTIFCTREAVKRMRRTGTGDIVNVTSESAEIPFPLLTVYGATKAGVENFTRTLNAELRQTDIRAMIARVGSMRTEGAGSSMTNEHVGQFVAAMTASGAGFYAGQGMDPASPARTIVAALATPRDARAQMVDIRSA